jgi:hypothetical protein
MEIMNALALEQAVHEIVRQPPPQCNIWTSREGGCNDLSAQLQSVLSRNHIVTERRLGKGHISLRYIQPGEEAIHIDPTYLQFFVDPEDLLPEIAVGTAQMIEAMLAQRMRAGARSSARSAAQFVAEQYINTKPYR